MPKLIFAGDPRGGENPPVCEMHGVKFPLNEAVEVADAVAAKLATHSHFQAAVETIAPETVAPKGKRK